MRCQNTFTHGDVYEPNLPTVFQLYEFQTNLERNGLKSDRNNPSLETEKVTKSPWSIEIRQILFTSVERGFSQLSKSLYELLDSSFVHSETFYSMPWISWIGMFVNPSAYRLWRNVIFVTFSKLTFTMVCARWSVKAYIRCLFVN